MYVHVLKLYGEKKKKSIIIIIIIVLLHKCIHNYNNNNTLHTMKYINSSRQDTSGEDGCGVGSHQVKVQPAINVT